MNELQIFNNPEFGEIRTISENGTVLFCGSDVARALGYTNPSKALTDHCKGITKRYTPTDGGEQLRKMEKKGYVVSGKPGEKGIYFWMTRKGLDWLGEKLRIQIHDPRD